MDEWENSYEFFATKLYLSKLAEKYKSRGYEKVFLEKDYSFLQDTKDIIKSINEQNDKLDEINKNLAKNIKKISKLKLIAPNTKKSLIENSVLNFAQINHFMEDIIRNEDRIIQTIDRFRKIEKEIDIKTKALTKYWFDKEIEYVFEWLKNKIHKEITIIIFDQNNLKNINETYGHQVWQESIYKFWTILKEELSKLWIKYILSNYYGWDEWFLVMIDTNIKATNNFIKKLFNTLKAGKYSIKDLKIELSVCAWITHLHPNKNTIEESYNIKKILQLADTLVLQAKIQKNRNKWDNAYKTLNISNFQAEDFKKHVKSIQTMPKKLKKDSLDKKRLTELFEIRKAQNEKIMWARTLWIKKILRFNIDLINEIIGQKIIESLTNILFETKAKTYNLIPEITKKIIHKSYSKIQDKIWIECLGIEEKEIIFNSIINSPEIKKYIKEELDLIFENWIFNIK